MATLSESSSTALSIHVTSADRQSVASRSARYAKAYYQGFLIALIVTWSPFKLLAYGAPFLMLGWFLLRTRSKTVFWNLALFGLLAIVDIALHMPFVHSFAWVAALLTVVTYSSFIPILVIPTRFLCSDYLFPRMQRWIAPVVVLEALLGIAQAFYAFRHTGSFDTSNGDYVEGTIHPWLQPDLSFANPMFASNMTILLLALAPALMIRRKYLAVVAIGLVSLILASVVHVLLFLAAAVAIVGLFYMSVFLRRFSSWLLAVVAIAGVLLTAFVLRDNLGLVQKFASTTLLAETPRGEVVKTVLTTMPGKYPLMPFVGLGPGQFSSRAALIATGQYLGGADPRPLPLVPAQMSGPMAKYFWREFDLARGIQWYGSTQQPAFSWLSFYTEMGGIACLIVILFVAILLVHIRRRAHSYQEKVYAMALSVGILFVCFLGLQENYWEIPQAIFPGLLILKALYAHFIVETRRGRVASRAAA